MLSQQVEFFKHNYNSPPWSTLDIYIERLERLSNSLDLFLVTMDLAFRSSQLLFFFF